jgi:hypothetical protein
MNSTAASSPDAPRLIPRTTEPRSLRTLFAATVTELFRRERRLALFGFALLALLVPLALAGALDERTLRGANAWLKPMKFALSLGLFALTTAWFVGHLLPAARRLRALDWIVWVLIGSASFELAYIALQAGLGQGSHYNVGDPLHGALYGLMGLGATALTATQPALAWLLLRHADPRRAPAYRLAVLIGLVLTFVLGATVGGLLSGLQPPETAALPVIGWSLAGGDLRPAHFLGIHAQQALPLLGLVVAGGNARSASRTVWTATAAYVLLFAAALAWGLVGRL